MIIKKTALLLAILLIANTASADTYSKEEKTTSFVITPSLAYRYDVFKWAIPDVHYPNKKCSELTWKNYIFQPSIKIELEPKPNEFTFLGQAKYGCILKSSSKNSDEDWWVHKQKSGKVISTPDSKSLSAVKGKILDLLGAIGYSLGLFKDNLVIFYVGYDYSDYKNNNYGYRQLVDNRNELLHPFNQLISRYYFKTQSPWIGLSTNIFLNDKFLINPTIKYYSFKYIGKGYWLLRDDFKQNPSFKHTAKGKGFGAGIDLIYKYSHNLDFNINLETKRLKMRKKGENKMYYNKHSGKGEITTTNKLWNLSLISSSISCGVRYKL